MIHHGDCVEVMAGMEAESIDAIVTDPPYGLEFMGKEWDRLGDDAVSKSWDTRGRRSNTPERQPNDPGGRHGVHFKRQNPRCRNCGRAAQGRDTVKGFVVCHCEKPDIYLPAVFPQRMQAWHEAWAREAFRVAKPGAYLVAAGGTRTFHRLVAAIEDAGWEIRDTLIHCYASGFPKSASVAKASTVQSWAALLPSAPHSSGTPEGSQDGYRSGCRLCGQPLRSVSVVVRDAERLSGGAPGCSHPSAPSVDIQLGSGRTYRACHACLSCRPSTPDCAHLASAPLEPPVAQGTNGAGVSGRKHRADGQQLSLHQTPDDGTPARSSDASLSEAKPHRSGTGTRTARRGQTEAYTHSTLGCPSCHEAYAQQAVDYAGFGTALKPSFEPWTLARKPLRGTVAANVLAHGTGALNIDATRIGTGDGGARRDALTPTTHDAPAKFGYSPERHQFTYGGGWHWCQRHGRREHAKRECGHPDGQVGEREWCPECEPTDNGKGRWPANLILSDPIFDGDTPGVVGGGMSESVTGLRVTHTDNRGMFGVERGTEYAGDSGTYSRFFLIPKSSRSDREPLVRGAVPSGGTGLYDDDGYRAPGETRGQHTARGARENQHPTVKPVDLMRHLVRLVTPPGGTVLDCFLGSGTTAIAAEMEGFAWIGIEKEAEYVAIAEARLNGVQKGMAL